MTRTTFKALIALSAIASAFVIQTGQSDAAVNLSNSVFDNGQEIVTATETHQEAREMKLARNSTKVRRKGVRFRKKTKLRSRHIGTLKRRKLNVTQHNSKPNDSGLGPEWMGGFCNTAGGGASTNPDGSTSCVDADGNDVLDPTEPND